MTRRLTVTIDELVLDGVQAEPGLSESIRAELTRLALQRAPREESRSIVRAGALEGGPLGRGIARAVHRGLAS